MERAIQHQAQQGNRALAQGLHRQQGVVEGAQAAAGYQQHRQPPGG